MTINFDDLLRRIIAEETRNTSVTSDILSGLAIVNKCMKKKHWSPFQAFVMFKKIKNKQTYDLFEKFSAETPPQENNRKILNEP